MSEGWILTGNVFPEVPDTACTDFGIPVWCMVLVTVNGTLCTASVCDKYEVVFCQDDDLFPVRLLYIQLQMQLFLPPSNLNTTFVTSVLNWKSTPACFEVSLHRKNEGFVLIVFGKFQCTENQAVRQYGG